jgi:tetratricopeptide (TPR) repeat protein
MTGRAKDVDQALEELGKVDLPDHPLFLYTRVQAYLVAAHADGQDQRGREEALHQAGRAAERLAQHPANATALQARCYYYFVRGDDDALLAATRQARNEHVEDAWVTDVEVSVHYGRKEYDKALGVLESTKYAGDESFPFVERGVVLAAMPGRKQEAERALTEAIRACKGFSQCFIASYLQLLGPEYRAKTRQASLEIRERSARGVFPWRGQWYRDLLAFHAGLIDERELLPRAGSSRFNLCEAHFYLGLAKLTEGKRAQAKECFRRSMGTGVFFFYEFLWSRAFLARIDDTDWLPWASLKK